MFHGLPHIVLGPSQRGGLNAKLKAVTISLIAIGGDPNPDPTNVAVPQRGALSLYTKHEGPLIAKLYFPTVWP